MNSIPKYEKTETLIRSLREAASDMRRGVHIPAHIALMKEAANALYDLSHPKNWTLNDEEIFNGQEKS